ANDLNLTYSSMDQNSVACRFTHPFRPMNGSKLHNLDGEFYLIYAAGPFQNNSIQYHRAKRGVSAYHVNLTRIVESRTASDALATDGCGKTVGCLRYPVGCSGTNCSYMATYRYQGGHVIFEMFGKQADWVAIGFSDNDVMPDTDAVVCQRINNQSSTVVIRSSRIPAGEYQRPPLEIANDLVLTGRSFFSQNIQCRFTHPYIPGAGSELRNLSQDAFLLYAKGAITGGEIDYHSRKESRRGASPQRVDLKISSDIGKEEPNEGGISTDGCGKTVGCLRFASGCSGSSCEFVATYKYQPTTKLVMFEMFGKNADWVAIGFSDDKEMPDTDSVFCYNSNGNVLIRSAKLVSRSLPSLEEEKDLVLLENSMEAGIRCRFNYPLTPGNTSKLRSLDQEVFLLYAKGSVSGSPNQHSRSPSGRGSSAEPVNVTTTFEAGASSPSQVKKKVHGSLMAVVWILLASSGLFFARYTRDNWSDYKLFETKVWFQFHRFLMILVVLGTIISIVVIFVDLDEFTKQGGKVKTHAIIGLVVLALAVLQPVGALLRPHPGTPNRPYFNIFHRTLGVSAFVLAIVAIILGLDIFNKDEAYYTVIGYAGFLAGVLIIMEISKFLYERTDETIEEATVPGGMQMQSDIVAKSSFHLTLSQLLLGIVDIVSLVVTVVVIYFISKDDEE
ncbi:Hypothetical predicted protein, partial [Paramuricea clavata]